MPSDPSLDGKEGVRTLWKYEDYPVPDWALDLVDAIVEDFLPEFKKESPLLVFVPMRSSTRYGGRHYPRENAIAVYESKDEEVTKSVVCHEMAHWIRKRTGDPNGHHDQDFFDLLGEIYEEYGVDADLARDVEPHCDTCDTRWRW